MNKFVFAFTCALCVATLAGLSSCGDKQGQNTSARSATSEAKDLDIASRTIVDYIASSRRWARESYAIEFLGRENAIFIFAVKHADDGAVNRSDVTSLKTGGKSLLVRVDTSHDYKLEVFAFQ